jgi:hypothetical protein
MHRIGAGSLFFLAAAVCGAQARNLPDLAAGVLSQVDQAKQAVRNRDQNAALDHVRQARSLTSEIQSRTSGQPEPVLIPVHTETDTTTTYTDVKHDKGSEMSADRMKRNTHVSDVEQQTSVDELNVTTAADYLSAAESALQRLDWTGADTDLANVGNLVHTTANDQPLSLLQAHQNLLLARARLVEQNYNAAVAPLRETEHALSDFEQRDRGPLAQQAEDMRQDIEAMAEHIQHDGSLDKIDDWLRTLEKWENTRKDKLQPPQH